jgi:hypothetical protein
MGVVGSTSTSAGAKSRNEKGWWEGWTPPGQHLTSASASMKNAGYLPKHFHTVRLMSEQGKW